MPRYEYICENKECNKEAIIECKMHEMKSTLLCECGKSMKRKVENMVCGYQARCDGFYGKKSN